MRKFLRLLPMLALLACPALFAQTQEPVLVVFYGDSITASWNIPSFFPNKPYVGIGSSGAITQGLLSVFSQRVVALHPAVVVILAGTNDIAGNHGDPPIEDTKTNLRSMAEQAKAHGIRVVMSSVLPVLDYPWRRGQNPVVKIKELNLWIADYCKEQHITYLDYYSAMVGKDGGMKPGLSRDGVHPTPAGYAIMAPLAQAAIDENLPEIHPKPTTP